MEIIINDGQRKTVVDENSKVYDQEGELMYPFYMGSGVWGFWSEGFQPEDHDGSVGWALNHYNHPYYDNPVKYIVQEQKDGI